MPGAGAPWTPLAIALLWAGAYLLGGIPVGWLMGRAAGVDLRQVGTGKIGTSNLFHTVGLLPAAFVGPAQFGQGLVPVLAADLLGAPAWVAGGAGLAAVVGNGWPIYFRYNGGRGVGTATGAIFLWSPVGVAFVPLLLAVSGIGHRSGLGVLVAYLGLPAVLILARAPTAYAVIAVGILLCLVLRRFEGYYPLHKERRASQDSFMRRLLDDWRPGPEGPDPGPPVNSRA
jgi:glycerol-3-phosphate acyltransferase PlsY